MRIPIGGGSRQSAPFQQRSYPFPPFGFADAAVLKTFSDAVSQCPPRVKGRPRRLKYHLHFFIHLPQGLSPGLCNIAASQQNTTRRHVDKAAYRIGDGAFSRPGRTDQADAFAFFYAKTNPIQRPDLSALSSWKYFRHFLQFQNSHRLSLRSFGTAASSSFVYAWAGEASTSFAGPYSII